MTHSRWAVVRLLFVALLAGATSCRRAKTEFDCQSVCSRYRECIDTKYDVATCRSRCRQNAAGDPGFQHKADSCEACIKGHSCMGAAFDCGGTCLGVVP